MMFLWLVLIWANCSLISFLINFIWFKNRTDDNEEEIVREVFKEEMKFIKNDIQEIKEDCELKYQATFRLNKKN